MKKRYFLAPLILLGGLTLGGAALSHTRPGQALAGRFANTRIGHLLMGRFGRAIALRAELNLTPEQKQAIKQTIQAHRADIKAAVTLVVQDRRALRDATISDANDPAAIRAAAAKLGQDLGDAAIEVNKVKTELKSKAGLTADQIQKIDDFRNQNDAEVDQFIKETN